MEVFAACPLGGGFDYCKEKHNLFCDGTLCLFFFELDFLREVANRCLALSCLSKEEIIFPRTRQMHFDDICVCTTA